MPTGDENIRLQQRQALEALLAGSSMVAAYECTWANLPAVASNAGRFAHVTDIGRAGYGSIWICDGLRWTPLGGRLVLKALTARSSLAGAGSETIAFQYTFPAGLLKTYDRLVWTAGLSKAGTTTAASNNWRFGTAGTTADTAIYTGNATGFAAASKSAGQQHVIRVESDTTVIVHGAAAAASSLGGVGSQNASTYASAVTVSGLTANAMILSYSLTVGATDAVALEDAMLELIVTP
jgi:hypothetical protein